MKIMNNWKRHPLSACAALAVRIAGAAVLLTLVWIAGFLTIRGIRYLTPSLFSLHYNSENVSLMPALINTLTISAFSLLTAVPTGVCAAVYLTEYAKRESRIVKLIQLTAETLAGIPSILYGLFGMLFFSTALGLGYSLMAGALTLVIMILPLIMRTAEEALLAVPDAYREASFGLGAGKLRTIRCVLLPAALPGILSGVILAFGRILGETAALIYTAGSVAKIAGFLDTGRTLAVHMYVLSSEGLYLNQAYATAFVLLVLSALISGLSGILSGKLQKTPEL